MKVLFAVLSCNRLHYLRNCVRSIIEFVPLDNAEMLVLDSASVEPGMFAYLDEISSYAMVHQFKDRVPNELYRSMNYAIKYCRQNKIDVINFVQDDYQYVFRNNLLLDGVRELFRKCKNVGQIHTNFLWKRKWKGEKTRTHKVVNSFDTNYAVCHPKHVRLCDNGFTKVSVYEKTGLYPVKSVSYDQNYAKTKGFGKNRYKVNLNGEMWFQSRCWKLRIKRAISFFPNQGMVYSCAYVRGTTRFGKYLPPVNEFYLKPFSESEIEKVNSRALKRRFSFIEDFIKTDGWKPAGPGKHDIYSGEEHRIEGGK